MRVSLFDLWWWRSIIRSFQRDIYHDSKLHKGYCGGDCGNGSPCCGSPPGGYGLSFGPHVVPSGDGNCSHGPTNGGDGGSSNDPHGEGYKSTS